MRTWIRSAATLAAALAIAIGPTLLLAPSVPAQASGSYTNTFDGMPATPLHYDQVSSLNGWDVLAHSRDRIALGASQADMAEEHGPDCASPPATHHDTSYEGAVFQCHDHIMTSIFGPGYADVVLTPPELVDFSGGTATVKFDMSTANTANGRDWPEIWLTPYDQQLANPLESWLPDAFGEPRNAVEIRHDTGQFVLTQYVNGTGAQIGQYVGPWNTFLTPSATIRTTFEIDISPTHFKFGIPSLNVWYADQALPTPLTWNQAVLQITHHDYDPAKGGGTPNTWHWDTLSISNAQSFTIVRSAPPVAVGGAESPFTFTFTQPTPPNAYLRFLGQGTNVRASFDGGATWQPVTVQPSAQCPSTNFADCTTDPGHMANYWMPMPAGLTSVKLMAGAGYWGYGVAFEDVSAWSLIAGANPPTPTPTSTATVTPTATNTPTLTPTATPICEVRIRQNGVEAWLVKPAAFCQP